MNAVTRLALVLLLSVSVPSAGSMSATPSRPARRRTVDGARRPIVIGYAHDPASGRAERAMRDGADVVIWSFLHFDLAPGGGEGGGVGGGGRGRIRTGLDLSEIRRLRDMFQDVVFMAAFGGWNGPHPPNQLTGKEWCDVFVEFNDGLDGIFDGIDFDWEGNDDLSSETARFTLGTLDVMADLAVEAKRRGLVVSMAPAESYLDAAAGDGSADAEFSRDLGLPPRAWTTGPDATDEDRRVVADAGFRHAGRQCYAYVLARAGVGSFDWISVQLYEAYSAFVHETARRGRDPVDAIVERVDRFAGGYTVTNLPLDEAEFVVRVPPSRLVIGIANGWADGTKFCKVEPSTMRKVYDRTLAKYGEGILGVMFWTIEEEGDNDGSRMTRLLREEFENCKRMDHAPRKDLARLSHGESDGRVSTRTS